MGKKSSDKEREKFLQTHKILKNYSNISAVAKKLSSSNYNEATEFVKIIEACLNQIKDEPNFDIIQLKYLENYTDEQIAEIKSCDKSTVWRQRNELIHKLSYILFPKQFF